MSNMKLVISWLLVGIPLAYGVFQTLTKAAALFS
ncbi:MFS transporter small subunit [Arthrobacter luteolus]